ncbi:MAG: chromosomal replication initiator DnaA [Caulobacter sp.]
MNAAQFRLPFEPATSWTRDAFVLSDANRSGVMMLDDWNSLGRGALALVGPAGSGKTHLAQAWADQAGAKVVLAGQEPSASGASPVLIEDADLSMQGEPLFHLLNQATNGRQVLITSRERPLTWATGLPDLRSRLNALPVAELMPPDDALLVAVLDRLFRARHIRPDADLYPYLLGRMERSVTAARRLVGRMDEVSAATGRRINKALARELLEDTADLFDEAESG